MANLPRVWSERESPPPWTKCSESSWLAALVWAGYGGFPRGAYTGAERDAFTELEDAVAAGITAPNGRRYSSRASWRSAGQPMFPLLRGASLKRYGVSMAQLPDLSLSGHRAVLSGGTNALILPGSLGRLPVGDRLRRWQPSYTGGHMITVIALGGGRVWWLDPLAPDGYAGEEASVDEALAFAWRTDTHYVQHLQLGQEGHDVINDYLKRLEEVTNRRAIINGGATARSSPAFDPKSYNANRLFALAPDRGSSATMLGWVEGTNVTLANGQVYDPGTRWFVTRNDDHGVCFWHERDLSRLEPIEETDCEPAVEAATSALRNRITRKNRAIDGAEQAIKAARQV